MRADFSFSAPVGQAPAQLPQASQPVSRQSGPKGASTMWKTPVRAFFSAPFPARRWQALIQRKQWMHFGIMKSMGYTSRELMLQRIESFSQMLSNQRERIKTLADSLKSRGAKIEKLQSLITLLNQQLDQKDKMITQLRAELNNKDVDIAKLKSHVGELTKANKEFAEYVEGQMKAEQEKSDRDNAVYVVVGSADILKQAGITSGGGLFSKKKVNTDATAQYFTKKDMRNFTQLEIPSAKPKIVSNMPKKSYKLEKTGKEQSVLTITDPASFWSQTRYLVVQTK